MTNIVDTAVFQRLRRVIQTSYSPLYSSAVHNRFVHSMGVFYLGELAVGHLIKEVEEKINPSMDLKDIRELFKLACLLHDVGHAPFSHTGEVFYLGKEHDYTQLHNKLIKSIGNEKFSKDIPKDSSLAAAPHEIMSAIIGITEFGTFFESIEQKEFFARCITGYKYLENTKDGHKYKTAYYKNAISVIENVVYAHDAERKWIQTHPVVLYEAYILQHIIGYLSEKLDDGDKKLFSLESLSKKGQRFRNGLSVSLLCDDDVIFLMKNFFYNELCEEFFERRLRRHPVWKSEAEYKAFVLDLATGGKLLEKEKETLIATDMDMETKNVQLENKEMILKVVHSLENYANEKGIDCSFVILMASQFNSGFGKPDFSATNIVFQTKEGEKNAAVGKIVSSIKAKERDRDNFFYLFYKRKDGSGIDENDIDNQEICNKLFKDVVF